MLKTSHPHHPSNHHLREFSKPTTDTKPNQKAVETRRRIEDIEEQRRLDALFSY